SIAVHFTTRSMVRLFRSSAALTFSSACLVSGPIPPGASRPVESVPRTPDRNTMLSTRTASEKGPGALGRARNSSRGDCAVAQAPRRSSRGSVRRMSRAPYGLRLLHAVPLVQDLHVVTLVARDDVRQRANRHLVVAGDARLGEVPLRERPEEREGRPTH